MSADLSDDHSCSSTSLRSSAGHTSCFESAYHSAIPGHVFPIASFDKHMKALLVEVQFPINLQFPVVKCFS